MFGRIKLPAEMRKSLGIKRGDKIELNYIDDECVIFNKIEKGVKTWQEE